MSTLDIHMNEEKTYTLAELAEKCGLTERTTRYYIEKVLPPHHKQGRGKLARYGQDTYNSIRFITLVKDRYGFKPGQAKGVLASVPQQTIDRVVSGEEDLAVMTVPSLTTKLGARQAGTLSRPSLRAARYTEEEHPQFAARDVSLESESFSLDEGLAMSDAGPEISEMASFLSADTEEPWQTVFFNDQVRVQCKGSRRLTPHQEEQIEAAARLIELALR